MEKMVINQNFWKGKKVLITGNTGFKGSWLTLLLHNLGSNVIGFSIEGSNNRLFNQLKIKKKITHVNGNINNLNKIKKLVFDTQPDVIIHMAAQSIVSLSYENPVNTWKTNVLGSVNILEAARPLQKKCSIVVVTTDKVYENLNLNEPYRENDRLGGESDPYSASKAACELVVACWKKSYLNYNNNLIIATARGGNVIGGGDWSKNRIVPDIINSIVQDKKIELRNPNSTRPWQYVLDALAGYLKLAEIMYENKNKKLSNSYNFGPNEQENITVETLVKSILKEWPIKKEIYLKKASFDEFKYLVLSNKQAFNDLGWKPKFDFNLSIKDTVEWYKTTSISKNYLEATQKAIEKYVKHQK